MNDLGLYQERDHHKTEQLYTFPNGSQVEFFGADNGQKLRGRKRDVLYVNESNELNFEEFTQLNMRTADKLIFDFNPSENFPKLQEKATTAEIGAAALGQGLTTSLESATDLAKFGVDRSTALRGYATIGEVLPTTKNLSNIYSEEKIDYTQGSAEAEVFKGSTDAATKRKRLASLERGSFSASAGNAPGAYSTGYLKKSSAAGQI
jgi:hypothetical protein